MNKNQLIGIGIMLIGIIISFFTDNNILTMLSGFLCAIGLGFILKFIPLKKQNHN